MSEVPEATQPTNVVSGGEAQALVPGVRRRGTSRSLAAWPLVVAFVGYPIWWALGFAPFVWIVCAIPMALRLLVSPTRVRWPRGFGLWFLFLGWVLLSSSQLDTSNRIIGFTFRFGEFLATTIIFLFVYNLPRRSLSAQGGIRILAGVWLAVVGGGYLALANPDGALPSLASRVLPRSLTSNDFISVLITPEFAQVHNFLGFPLARPAAPFNYTNTWGAVFALTLPYILALALTSRSSRGRIGYFALICFGTVPAIISVNRSMWAAVVLVLAFLAVSAPSARDRRALRLFIGIATLALVLGSSTWVIDLVNQRIDTPHSNAARGDLALETTDSVLESPLLGYGSPRPYEGPGTRPHVGTHGYLWYIAFAHGVPALAFFCGWFVLAFVRARRGDPAMSAWFRASLVALVVILPFYGLRGMPLNVLALGAALCLRPSEAAPIGPAESPRTRGYASGLGTSVP